MVNIVAQQKQTHQLILMKQIVSTMVISGIQQQLNVTLSVQQEQMIMMAMVNVVQLKRIQVIIKINNLV